MRGTGAGAVGQGGSVMQPLPFAGPRYTGSVETGVAGISVFATPSDPNAEPGMAVVTFDPTPDDAEAIATRIWTWATVRREMEMMAAQLMLPGLETQGASRNKKGT